MTPDNITIEVADFFSGCGGTSKGFENAGLTPVLAIDNDEDSKKTFKRNFPQVKFLLRDIYKLKPKELANYLGKERESPILFSGCAPCQPFTKQKTIHKENDPKKGLLLEFLKFIEYYLPEYIFIENVPGIQKVDGKDGTFPKFIEEISKLGYFFKYKVIQSQEFGVPQMRRRLILIGSLLGPIDFPPKTHGPGTTNPNYATVRQFISEYPRIRAGETCLDVPNHRAAALSDTNLRRIRYLEEGQDRRSWPEDLVLECHKNDYSGHTDVYGRMWWDKPASGLTTRCISLSNGRFGHPDQDRAISVREAAALQTFPNDFIFTGNLNSMARQIGNAVPVLLAEKFGENFIEHFSQITKEKNNARV